MDARWRDGWKQAATKYAEDFNGGRAAEMAGAFANVLDAYGELEAENAELIALLREVNDLLIVIPEERLSFEQNEKINVVSELVCKALESEENDDE